MIDWPSGVQQVLTDISADQLLQVTEPSATDLTVAIKVVLEGPYDSGSGLMKDDLRDADAIPAGEPFTDLGLNHVHQGGGESIANYNDVMNVTGDDGIVDWIFVELRSKADPTSIVATRSALLQRDGDIVDVDGLSEVLFANLVADDYYIVVRHRNHFAVRSANTFPLSSTSGALIDFSDPNFETFGTNAQNDLSGVQAMIAGDANRDGQINAVDKNSHWRPQNGQTYDYATSLADFNLDAAVNAVDKNAYWRLNNSKTEQID